MDLYGRGAAESESAVIGSAVIEIESAVTERVVMKWNVATAKQRFSEVVRAAAEEPQPVYSRSRLVAVVVDAASFEAFRAWQARRQERTVAEAFAELRALCEEGDDAWPSMPRVNRDNPFADATS